MNDLQEKTEEIPAGLIEIRARFERAWKEALSGGPRPHLETFLQLAAQKDRLELHSHLAAIEKNYQQQVSLQVLGASGMTVAFERQPMPEGFAVHERPGGEDNEGTLREPGSPAPVILPPDTAHDAAGGTIDFQPAHKGGAEPDVAARAGPGDTIGFVPANEAAASGDHTIDAPRANPQLSETIGAAPPGPEEGSKKGLTVPGYEILGELGRGAMGVVYKARQKRLNRLVALKMMLAGSHAGPEQLARFQTEAESVARLQNPNIVQIYEVGEHDDLPFFSLEFVDGGTLAKQLGGKPQPPQHAAQMIETLARAMDCAHRLDIIHRDLKPANILLTANGILKISDFGLAKRLEAEDSGQTRSGTLMGTPSYMSPEQAHGDTHAIGPPADQYALGVMLYEMLTGRPPFQGASILDTLQQVRTHEPVPPSRLQPTVPRDLETICLKCLQKESGKRYASTGELAEDLRRFQTGEPIQARPIGRAERLWRWCKRNPKVASLYAAVGTLLVTVAAFLVTMAVRAAEERETIGEASKQAQQRLELATEAIRAGRYRQAQAPLRWSDPLLEGSPALAEVRDNLRHLRAQVDLYVQFKDLLDKVRYYALFGPKTNLKEASASCQQLIELFEEIENKTGRASCGMPPLDTTQEKLLQEEYFETFLVLAQIEWDLAALESDSGLRQAGARKAVAWLDRAERVYAEAWTLYFRRGNYLEKLGDSKRALADRERMAKMRPTLPLDRFWLAFALHLQGDALKDKNAVKAQESYRRAIKEYAALLRVRPDHFWAYFDEALCHLQLGNLDDAVIGFTMCIQIRPEVIWPYFNRGVVLLQQKQHKGAVEDLTVALEHDPNNADAVLSRAMAYDGLDKADLALADLDRLMKLKPALGAAFFQRGEIYRKLNRSKDALIAYDRAEQLDAKNPAIYTGRGLVYLFSLIDYAKARDDFGKAIGLRPEEPNDYRLHGLASLHLYDFSAAHRDWKALAKLLPKDPEPLQNDAITYKAEGRYDEALKALAAAIQIGPRDSKTYLFRAQIYHQLGKLKEAESEHMFVLNQLKDRRAEVLNDHGDLLRTMSRRADALSTYEQSIKLLPKQTDAYVGIALVHLLAGKPELAEATIEQMMTANAGSFRACLRRAEFHRSCSRWDQALKDSERAAGRDPKSPLPSLVRASIRAGRGEFRQAVEDAERVLRTARPDGQLFYTAACVWSLASQAAQQQGDAKLARQFADRAAAFVADTLKKGSLDLNFQAYNRLLIDPALAPIRRHPIVVELLPVLRQSSG